jgi:hypothetical protein
MAERPLDIFQVLEKIDLKQRDYFSGLTEKEAKSFAPIVVTRWLSGTYNKSQVIIINEIVNPYIFSLHHHKLLLWYLMTIGTSGKKQRYSWNKTKSNKALDTACILCIKDYFNYSSKDAEQVYKTIDKKHIIDMAEELGYQDGELNRIKKELGLSSTPTKTVRKKRTPAAIQYDGEGISGFNF